MDTPTWEEALQAQTTDDDEAKLLGEVFMRSDFTRAEIRHEAGRQAILLYRETPRRRWITRSRCRRALMDLAIEEASSVG